MGGGIPTESCYALCTCLGCYARGRDITRMPTSIGMVQAAWGVPMCVCNPASTTDNLCPTLGGGIPTRTVGRLRAATLSSLNCYLRRLPTLTYNKTTGIMSNPVRLIAGHRRGELVIRFPAISSSNCSA
eukprot:scaffold73879_cov69-Attheya_sp.AAC.1